jgi:alkylation response protein AidB-like acyl-CoA dehydrogenase
MDLNLEPDELDFRDRLVAWLDEVDLPVGLRDYGATPTLEDIEAGREWQQLLWRAGWAGLSWPQPFGPGASVMEQAIFAETLAERALPRQLSFVTMELAGPIIISFGNAAQQERHLGPILAGDEIWCQLFSEPEAGSDLAGLRTKAHEVDESSWLVRGQKVWTSGAHYSQFGLLLARTDPTEERHRGITCFALPMDRRGIEVRPITQMDGEAKFNEVFLDDVEVHRSDVLGEVGQGWSVALSILGRERRMLGSLAIGLSAALLSLRSTVQELGRDDAGFRSTWGALYSRVQALRWTWFRLISSTTDALTDPRMSILKLSSSELQQAVARLGLDVLDGDGRVTEEVTRHWQRAFLASHGATLAGGTSEIQRGILAERVLGLPR